MNFAEFKTLREGLHLSQVELASIFGVGDRLVRRWEQGNLPIPPHQSARLLELNRAIDRAVMAAVAQVARFTTLDQTPQPVVLLRYMTDADFERYRPDDFAALGSCKVHAAMLGRVKTVLDRDRIDCVIVGLVPAEYEAWLDGRPDTEQERAHWAALNV